MDKYPQVRVKNTHTHNPENSLLKLPAASQSCGLCLIKERVFTGGSCGVQPLGTRVELGQGQTVTGGPKGPTGSREMGLVKVKSMDNGRVARWGRVPILAKLTSYS